MQWGTRRPAGRLATLPSNGDLGKRLTRGPRSLSYVSRNRRFVQFLTIAPLPCTIVGWRGF